MRLPSIAAGALCALGASLPLALHGQVMASEHASVAQTVNGTTVTVEYYRPQARGRELFGKTVSWGRHWTPGANWATTLEVDHDVRVEGQALPKGKYSVWAIPQPDQWTVRLHRTAHAFHMSEPDSSDVQLSITTRPAQGPYTEVLTWSFPVVTHDGTELHMRWGTTDLALHLATGGAGGVALSSEERARYVGTYLITRVGQNRFLQDTAVVFDSAGMLHVRREHFPSGRFYDAQFDLHPVGEHTFVPIMYQQGKMTGAEPGITFVFQLDSGRVTGFESHGPDGAVAGCGKLVKLRRM